MRTSRRNTNSEAGFTLVEVIVSAALVLIVATTVLGSVNHSVKLSGASKAKTSAANIAQQDQERMRGLRIDLLANLFQKRNVVVDGTVFTVTSSGTFISDTTQTPGCTSTSRADYIQITTQVTSPRMERVTPVSIKSIVHPPVGSFGAGQGSMVVQIRNAAGQPLPGILVTIDGPGRFSQETTSEGCAFFAFVPVGSYLFSYSSGGYVDMSGVTAVSLPATVQSEQTISYQTTYDKAGMIDATFETIVKGQPAGPSLGEAVSAVHPNIPGGGVRIFSNASGDQTNTLQLPNLFPFTSPYSIYSGACSANELPTTLYNNLPPGVYARQQLVAPGSAYAVRLFQPAFNDIRVRYAGAQPGSHPLFKSVRIVAQLVSSGCSGTFPRPIRTDGTLADIDNGFPYGQWRFCAEVTRTDGKRNRVFPATTYVNDQVNGLDTSIHMDITPSTTDTVCP